MVIVVTVGLVVITQNITVTSVHLSDWMLGRLDTRFDLDMPSPLLPRHTAEDIISVFDILLFF